MKILLATATILLTLLAGIDYVTCRLELRDNGYEGLNIVIQENVKENPQLLTRIREVFTALSSKMYTATRRRAFIRNVTVVIPKSWTNKEYAAIPDVTSKTQVITISKQKRGYRKAPYVTGKVDCGKGGQSLKMTPEFLLYDGDTPFGPQDSVLLHNWGHFRWGLFDEYPSVKRAGGKGKKEYIQFYRSGGQWRPVSCTRNLRGETYNKCNKRYPCNIAGLVNIPANCLFCPVDDPDVKASFMGHQWLSGLDSFCDRDNSDTDSRHRHNSEAPNLQNVLCKGQSAWEVMRKHVDFSDDVNAPGSLQQDSTPDFRFVQKSGRVRVIVMDVSGSMRTDYKMVRQEQAVRFAIGTLVETGSRVGMVKFNDKASILAQLMEVRDKKDRNELIEKIPTDPHGGTSIGAGLRKALEVLDQINSRLCEIILITDGQNTDPPSIGDVRNEVISAGVVVHTIAVSQAADSKLAQLADDTGGVSLTYLGSQTISFGDALSQVITSSSAIEDEETPETLFSGIISASANVPVSGQFTVDFGLGKDTTLTVMSDSETNVDLSLTGPHNFNYHTEITRTHMAIFELETNMTSGQYSYTIETTSETTLNVYVTSKPQSVDSAVLRVRSWLSEASVNYAGSKSATLHAEVLRDDQPVLGANVHFLLEPQPTGNFAFGMNDLGTGADSVAYDGIYSSYLVNAFFTQNGRYNIKIIVKGDDSTFTWTTAAAGAGSIPNPEFSEEDYYEDEVEEKIGQFDRLSLPGELTVENYDVNLPDITPPARIHDLYTGNTTMNVAGTKAMTFTFQWTAVGDDMDVGQAEKYEFFMTSDFTALQQGNNTVTPMLDINDVTPKTSGKLETLTLSVSKETCSGTCYLAVRAVDENGNTGDMSNIVPVEADYAVPFNSAPHTRGFSFHFFCSYILVLTGIFMITCI